MDTDGIDSELYQKLCKYATATLMIAVCASVSAMVISGKAETPRIVIIAAVGWCLLYIVDQLKSLSTVELKQQCTQGNNLQIRVSFGVIVTHSILLVALGFVELYAPVLFFVIIAIGNAAVLKCKADQVIRNADLSQLTPVAATPRAAVIAHQVKDVVVAEMIPTTPDTSPPAATVADIGSDQANSEDEDDDPPEDEDDEVDHEEDDGNIAVEEDQDTLSEEEEPPI